MTQKWVLITGAGSGIGRAIAINLADAGHGIVLMGRRLEHLEETAYLVGKSSNLLLAQADVREPHSIREALLKCGLDTLYGVVANAGVGGENLYGEKDRWADILATNLSGTYYTVNETLPFLRKGQRQGEPRHVLVIASILARLGVPGYSAYCAAKAGLLGLVRAWASEFAPESILVNAICPGWVQTQMAMEGLQSFADHSGKSLDQVFQEQMSHVPLGKMSQPEEVAALVGFMMSGQQASMTGQTLDINNGALMP